MTRRTLNKSVGGVGEGGKCGCVGVALGTRTRTKGVWPASPWRFAPRWTGYHKRSPCRFRAPPQILLMADASPFVRHVDTAPPCVPRAAACGPLMSMSVSLPASVSVLAFVLASVLASVIAAVLASELASVLASVLHTRRLAS